MNGEAGVQPDETIYTDYSDQQQNEPSSAKLKTTSDRLPLWMEAHFNIYNGANVEWNHLEHQSTLRVNNQNGSLVVKFHPTTGVILVQGSQFLLWRDQHYNEIRRMVDQLDQATTGELVNHASPALQSSQLVSGAGFQQFRVGYEDVHPSQLQWSQDSVSVSDGDDS